MNISPHLIIDAVILSSALTITLLSREKGNAAKKKEIKWLIKKTNKNLKNQNYLKFGTFWFMGVLLVYLYSAYVFINKWHIYIT